MAWTQELALHHEELDGQHAELFRLLSAAAAEAEAGAIEGTERALAAFIEAMQAHVATEEALMEEVLFPERGRHRVAHEVFLADLQQLTAELGATSPSPRVVEWLKVRVPEWLRFHIAANDAPLGLFLARRPLSRAAPLARRAGAPGRGGPS